MDEGEIEETQQQAEPLFKPLCDSCQDGGAKYPNPKYEDGKVLSKKLRSRFLQEAKPCVPLEEIDPYFRNKQTFIVIGRWGSIHRFSLNPEGYVTLSPSNAFRRFAIYLQTNWIFSTLIVATILLNAFALVKTQNYEIMKSIDPMYKKTWVVDTLYIVDCVCLLVYCFELFVKVVARGLLGDAYTCLRDPWSWLDVLVIVTGFCPYTTFILARKSALWLRLFKIIPLVPSIRQAGRLSLKAVIGLRGMLLLLLLLLWFFSLLGTQLYMGTLTQKCIKQYPNEGPISEEMWVKHNSNMSNWFIDDYGPGLCGNISGARECPDKYVCLQGYGENPDFGYTNFDNIFWSLLSVIRIGSEDFTEEVFRQLLAANGTWHNIYFLAIFFLITFPLGCFFFAILGYFFTESKAPKELELEELTGLVDVHDFDPGTNPESLVIKAKSVDPQDEELVGFRKALFSFIYHDWVRYVIVLVILVDIIGIVSDYYGIDGSTFNYRLHIRLIPYVVFLLYMVEFLLKLIALGPAKFFRDRWNYIDLIVLLTFFLEIQSYLGHYTGYYLAPIRLLKLVQYWPSLRMVFAIYYKTVKTLWGWVLYTCIAFAFLVFIGPFEIGQYEIQNNRGGDKMTVNDIPRYSFIDFWHSFRVVVRMQIAEWIETLWDVLPYAGNRAFVYYLAVNLAGALLISFILIGIVYTTISELESYEVTKGKGLRFLVRKAFSLVYFPIQRIQPREMIMKNGADENDDDPETKIKPDDEEKGGRSKKSIVSESTGQLRKVMQDCTDHWAYKIACAAGIIVASWAMIMETKETSDDMQVALFVIEILFTVAFLIIIVYELLAFGVKESLTNRSWLFDAVIVFENILNLSIYQFSVTGPFRVGIFCIRSFRPLMLVGRVDWLKAPFIGIKYQLKVLWETILAVLFIWLLFDTFGVHWLAGLYFRCNDSVTGEEIKPAMTKSSCLANNHTWTNSHFNFDNSAHGFVNMVFLVSRMGWVSIINDASDAVGQNEPRITDVSKFWFFYFILFILCGGIGALGILFSYVFNKFQEDQGYNIILTENQVNKYADDKAKDPRDNWIRLEDEYVPVPDSPCLSFFYNMVTNFKFDGLVMLLIIGDNVLLSMDHYNQTMTLKHTVTYARFIILLLYTAEMVVKFLAWGKHYFRNGWNILDLAIVVMGLFELIVGLFMDFVTFAGMLRIFRLLRIFRFLLAKKWGSTTIRVFLSAVYNVRYAFTNLVLLQITVMWAFGLLGMYLFGNVVDNGPMGNEINFRTFRASLWTLALLLGFPCLDGLYVALGNEEDCHVKDPETTTCGSRIAAVLYIGLYAGITFLVLLNMYAVLITETISEIKRFKKKPKEEVNEEDVPLQDVTTDNAVPEEDEEEAVEPAEEPEPEAEEGE